MRFPIIIHLLSLFLLCSVLALPLVTTGSNDLSLTSRSDDCEPGQIYLVRRGKARKAKVRAPARHHPYGNSKQAGQTGTPVQSVPKPKVVFDSGVNNWLDGMNLHGKKRKQAKKEHKKIAIDQMKLIPGATTAVIKATAHHGGTNPNEPYHLTTKFQNAIHEPIPTQYKDQNGKPRDTLTWHVYVDKKKGPGKRLLGMGFQ